MKKSKELQTMTQNNPKITPKTKGNKYKIIENNLVCGGKKKKKLHY